MNAQSGARISLTPLALLGFAWSLIAPVLSEIQLHRVFSALNPDLIRVTILGSWIARHLEILRLGLWVVGLLSVIVAVLCVVRRTSIHASTSAALAVSLLSGSIVFLILFVCVFAGTLGQW